jgi:hypothetical protein
MSLSWSRARRSVIARAAVTKQTLVASTLRLVVTIAISCFVNLSIIPVLHDGKPAVTIWESSAGYPVNKKASFTLIALKEGSHPVEPSCLMFMYGFTGSAVQDRPPNAGHILANVPPCAIRTQTCEAGADPYRSRRTVTDEADDMMATSTGAIEPARTLVVPLANVPVSSELED